MLKWIFQLGCWLFSISISFLCWNLQFGPYVQWFDEKFLHSTISLISFNALLMLFAFSVILKSWYSHTVNDVVISTLFCDCILFTLLPFLPIIRPIAVFGITTVEVSAWADVVLELLIEDNSGFNWLIWIRSIWFVGEVWLAFKSFLFCSSVLWHCDV